jgi:hypothetical protein
LGSVPRLLGSVPRLLGSAPRLLARLLTFGVLYVGIERETRRETASAPKQRAAVGPNPGLGGLGFD